MMICVSISTVSLWCVPLQTLVPFCSCVVMQGRCSGRYGASYVHIAEVHFVTVFAVDLSCKNTRLGWE